MAETTEEKLARLEEIERTFNEGWLPALPGEHATLRLKALYRLRELIPDEALAPLPREAEE